MRRHNKTAVGFQAGQYRSSDGYLRFTVHVYDGKWVNLATVYEENGRDYDLENLKKLRETTGQTWCFEKPSCGRDLEFSYQSHRLESTDYAVKDGKKQAGDYSDWYAPHITSMGFTGAAMRLVAKLHKQHVKAEREYDDSPESLLATLADLGAVPLKYATDCGFSRYYEDQEWSLDSIVPQVPNRVAYSG